MSKNSYVENYVHTKLRKSIYKNFRFNIKKLGKYYHWTFIDVLGKIQSLLKTCLKPRNLLREHLSTTY